LFPAWSAELGHTEHYFNVPTVRSSGFGCLSQAELRIDDGHQADLASAKNSALAARPLCHLGPRLYGCRNMEPPVRSSRLRNASSISTSRAWRLYWCVCTAARRWYTRVRTLTSKGALSVGAGSAHWFLCRGVSRSRLWLSSVSELGNGGLVSKDYELYDIHECDRKLMHLNLQQA